MRPLPLLIALLMFGIGPARAESTRACGAKLRTISVVIAVDAAINAEPGEVDRIRARIETVSQAYTASFNVGFKVVNIVTWQPLTEKYDFAGLRDQLKRDVSPAASGMLIGFLSNPIPSQRSGFIGLSRTFENTILMYDEPVGPESYKADSIGHEIGHCFGGWHSSDPNSIMFARNTNMNFAPQISKVICLTREFDFGRDVRQLSAKVDFKITDMYDAEHPSDDAHIYNPVAYTYTTIGIESEANKDFAGAEEDFCWASYLSPGYKVSEIRLAITLYLEGKDAAAWRAVHIGQKFGVQPPASFLKQLQDAMVEPSESVTPSQQLCRLPRGKVRR